MTTFTVLACLPAGSTDPDTVDTDLQPRMIRYDRTWPTAPYRVPVTTTLTAFARQQGAIDPAADSADLDLDACDLAERLGAWRFLAHHHNANAFGDDERVHVDEDARPYTISTTNPNGMHDRWWVGGMWTDMFQALPFAVLSQLVHPRVCQRQVRCAGGIVQALDLAGMQATARVAADAAYDRWETAVAGTPEAAPWSQYADRHDRAPQAYPLSTAAADFIAQPRLQALTAYDESAADRFGSLLYGYNDVVDEFQAGRDTFVAYHARRAVLGFAMLTLDGIWLAPGQIGRFASSTDTFRRPARLHRTGRRASRHPRPYLPADRRHLPRLTPGTPPR